MNKQLVKAIMDNLKSMYPGEIEGVIPDKIDYLVVLEIMKEIIQRTGSIRNQIKIIEMIEHEYLVHSNRNLRDIADKIITGLHRDF
jgi:flagellar biosynthesis component FlhA